LRRTAELEEAEALYERAYRGLRQTLGDADPSTLRVGKTLADVLRDRGKWPRAEYVMREIAEVYRRLYGDGHEETLAALEHVGRSMSMQRKYAEAETVLREVVDGRRRALGSSDPAVLESTRRLIGVIRKQDRLEEAERLAAELVEQAAAMLDDDDWRLARFHEEYGLVLDRMGKYDLAEKSFVAAYERYTQTRGTNDRRTVAAIRRLIEFYESREKPELAAQFNTLIGGVDDP
ncbi:MAG: tetratricopeptide repeat protein, partial [Planctomycetes bacterium]|nr:tetratricopeptide repeat protein [Planctomycetota bacterium]